jgi:hypothetical protein
LGDFFINSSGHPALTHGSAFSPRESFNSSSISSAIFLAMITFFDDQFFWWKNLQSPISHLLQVGSKSAHHHHLSGRDETETMKTVQTVFFRNS